MANTNTNKSLIVGHKEKNNELIYNQSQRLYKELTPTNDMWRIRINFYKGGLNFYKQEYQCFLIAGILVEFNNQNLNTVKMILPENLRKKKSNQRLKLDS